MSALYPSLEAINFQHNSPLAKRLVELCQDIINYRDSVQTSIQDRVKETIKYVNKHFFTNFKALVLETTGLTCNKVVYSKYLDYGYACVMDVGDKYGLNANKFIDEYSGTGMQEQYKWLLKKYEMRCTTAEDLYNVVQSLRKDTGIFSVDQLYDGKKISFTLYFDPYGAFLAQEVGHSKCLPMTAEEIAAIVIHEIGHLHSMLEHALDGCMRMSVAFTAYEYFSKNAPVEEKKKVIQDLTDKKTQSETSDKADELIEQRKSGAGAYILDGIGIFFGLIMDAALIGTIPLSIITQLFSYAADNSTLVCLNFSNDKLSDQRISVHNYKLCERLADQFVVRHGLGRGLISSLNKIEHNAASGMGNRIFAKNSSAAWTVRKIRYFIYQLLSGDMYYLEGHDETPVRNELVLLETIEVFKQSLPPDMLDFYIADYEASKKALGDRTLTLRIADGILIFNKLMRYLAETPSALIANGRFPREYDRLVYKIKQLIGNKLYYRAAKLTQLLNQK